jgi:type I restriction enzyme S subunit
MENKEGYKKTAIGWIPEDWEVKKYKEVLNEVNRPYLWDDNREYHLISVRRRNGGCFFRESLRGNQIKTKTLRPIQKDDFIISKMQVVHGATSIVPENFDGMFVSSSYIIMDAKPILNIHYINFWAQMPRFYQDVLISSHGVHIEKMTFKLSSFMKLFMPVPPLPEQTKIADILTTVDDKISSIDSKIQQTEQLKKGLMEKLLTEGIGHKEFKETEIGRIPVGWDVSTLAEAKINIIDGDRGTNYPKQDDFYEDGFCLFLTAKNVSKSGFRFDETQYISEERDGLLRKGKLVRNDIVITTRGTVGNIAWYNANVKLENIRINSGMALIRKSFENVDSMFLYLLFRSHLVQKQIKLIAFGSAQPQLTIKEIKKFRIVLPPLQEQKQIATILSTVDDKLDILTQKKSHYQTLKKGLSQQLLTGQMRVKV